MATAMEPLESTFAREAKAGRKIWGWFLAFGIAQIVLGAIAVSHAFGATVISVMTLGFLLLIGAAAQMAAAIWAWNWRGFFVYLLVGLIYAVTGGLMVERPCWPPRCSRSCSRLLSSLAAHTGSSLPSRTASRAGGGSCATVLSRNRAHGERHDLVVPGPCRPQWKVALHALSRLSAAKRKLRSVSRAPSLQKHSE